MKYFSKTILRSLITIGTIIGGAAAIAAPATSNVSLNVRTGPGTTFNVVDTLYGGELVEVSECVSNGWCRIEHTGPDGWVSSKYLTPYTGGSSTPAPAPPSAPTDPNCSFGITFGSGGPAFSISCGDAPPPPAPPAPPAPIAAKACFYKGNNYTGAKACMPANVTRPNMTSSWNDSLSSLTLSGGAKVKLCQGTNFTGLCTIFTNDKAVLNSGLNNKVSSYEVFTGATPAPVPAPTVSQACFYKGNNFSGSKVCKPVGTNRPAMSASWNNAMSSVKLTGGAKVRLCQGTNYTGLCTNYSNNKAILNSALNNKISSYIVYAGAAPALPAPPAPPAVVGTYSTGPINLNQTHMVNLDTGAVGAMGADIWYQAVTAVNKYITPRNGAKLALGDGSNRGYAGCSAASFSTNKISLWTMPIGSYVCVKTNEGRISQFRLNGYNGTTMRLGYTTWEN